jgi:hypothetical protein
LPSVAWRSVSRRGSNGVIGSGRAFWSGGRARARDGYDRAIRGGSFAWALAAAALLAGCGNQDVAVAPECLENASAVTKALARAPGEVRLGGRVRISDCFQNAASSADVQNLGAIFIQATGDTAQRVRKAPHSHAAVELGYLVGAVRRGAHTDGGVHYEAGRRVEQELIGVPTRTPEFRRGLQAGERSG